jgi:glucuronate isomerase
MSFIKHDNDFELFKNWCQIFPSLIFNPLYDWTKLELKKYFYTEIEPNSSNVAALWEQLNNTIVEKKHSPRSILIQSGVEIICTSDDPTDSLEYHQKIREEIEFKIKVLPTFRLDNLFYKHKFNDFNSWLKKLEIVTNKNIINLNILKDGLIKRHEVFHDLGCRMSDHGLESIRYIKCSDTDAEKIFFKILNEQHLSPDEIDQWNSYILVFVIELNHSKKWTTLLHLGAIRNNNSIAFQRFGLDNGTDSIGDFSHVKGVNDLLNYLEEKNKLHKVMLFNLNPADNYLFSSIMGNFYSNGIINKVQHGPAWWFLDTREGITDHFNSYSNLGIYENFSGMVTDSRSFTSFVRHDYYRRTLAGLMASKIMKNEIITDESNLQRLIKKVTYSNALELFKD